MRRWLLCQPERRKPVRFLSSRRRFYPAIAFSYLLVVILNRVCEVRNLFLARVFSRAGPFGVRRLAAAFLRTLQVHSNRRSDGRTLSKATVVLNATINNNQCAFS
jgi:hypothetical protein